ncbi:conserved hypothetical protein [Xenorhabdus nematophila F1]|uniref:Uncharacterized protein n=1 Tax=Xenorhabdus nematophila (strain ATCC 19061 / DSM 3370 / CCUG 14189 / LMG 1036 / NCIMB 9965 / AN6) TaxID=406817 RepID=D3VB21_XENNA|nr:hypothetical protein D3790_19500 [Xenorhabdus nematophila]CBJ91796.1 hypothetical protein XNC1_3765 [Xenorhabdus nematophila ATCC 19061]CCW32864.1 conserved hypothetical protein [Xenorhabdus nematophila F1]CEE90549.1 hypothetical protein XNA1_1590010 [Xenorhabdus nematophila str. Anatoliense]CEF28725.1 hypothetical protein XNW1_1350010 [Xenorhabdus nematophila str. Websteri]CEK24614.1 hypothetical protein XNC2_3620 [Xenorhabdus nematophila AN6/1]
MNNYITTYISGNDFIYKYICILLYDLFCFYYLCISTQVKFILLFTYSFHSDVCFYFVFNICHKSMYLFTINNNCI